MSEKVEGELKVFSAVLLQEYIRLMTAAHYINNGASTEKGVRFVMAPDVYEKMRAEPLQASLLGMTLDYMPESQCLSVKADAEFVAQFDNKIMKEVALKYAEDYKNRYASFVKIAE